MKSTGEPQGAQHSDDQGDRIRLSVFVPRTVHRNFEVFCIANSEKKQEVFVAAIREYLKNRGMDPELNPLVKYSYPEN